MDSSLSLITPSLDWFDRKIAHLESRVAILRELRAEMAADLGSFVAESVAGPVAPAPTPSPATEEPARPQADPRPPRAGAEQLRERIARDLAAHGPSGPKAIAGRLRADRGTVNRILLNNTTETFEKSGTGPSVRYDLTPAGRAALSLSGSSPPTG